MGAASAGETKTSETKPEEKTVPLAALMGEQANTKAAREQAAAMRTSLEAQGFTVADDGTVTAPAPKAESPTGVDAEVQELADSLGVDATKLQTVIDRRIVRTGGRLIDPISKHGFEQVKQGYKQEDPDYPIWAKTFDQEVEQRVKQLPAELQAIARSHPDILRDARAAARDKHLDEIATARAERKTKGGGKVVGTFVEGAAPGLSETPTPAPFSEQMRTWLRNQGTTDAEIARLEAARAARGGR